MHVYIHIHLNRIFPFVGIYLYSTIQFLRQISMKEGLLRSAILSFHP